MANQLKWFKWLNSQTREESWILGKVKYYMNKLVQNYRAIIETQDH